MAKSNGLEKFTVSRGGVLRGRRVEAKGGGGSYKTIMHWVPFVPGQHSGYKLVRTEHGSLTNDCFFPFGYRILVVLCRPRA